MQLFLCIKKEIPNLWRIYKVEGEISMYEIEQYTEKIFEEIKHIDEEGNEYWEARELQKVLEYKEWRKFNGVIEKAKKACILSDNSVLNHFVRLDKMVNIGSGAKRKQLDYKLSRYACYLIAQLSEEVKQIKEINDETRHNN